MKLRDYEISNGTRNSLGKNKHLNDMKTIELTKSNYKVYLPIDIAASSIAAVGACGEHGGVIIIDSKAQIYILEVDTSFHFKGFRICLIE